jgi:IPT/TIG domain
MRRRLASDVGINPMGGGGAPTPTVVLVTPNVGSAAGGNAITISGANYLSGATVTINGVSCTSVVVVNGNTITCVTPAFGSSNGTSTGQVVTVTTTSGSGSGSTIPSKFFFYPSNTAYNIHTRGDVGLTVAGGNVTNWADQSGTGNNWVAGSNWPTPTTINGLAAISCSAAGSQGMTNPGPSGVGDHTTFFVFRQASVVSGFDTIWYALGSGGFDFVTVVGGGGTTIVNASTQIADANAVAGGTTYCLVVTSNASGALQLEPNSPTTGVLTSITGMTLLQLAQNGLGGGFGFNGDIGEVLSYPGILSGGDIATVYATMQQNWATA